MPAWVTPEVAASARLMKINQVIAFAWALAFGVLALADLLLVLRPAWPLRIAVGLSAAALLLAWKFSAWYPARLAASQSTT